MATDSKILLRKKRHLRIRAKIKGTAERPRLSVFKSNKYIYAQLIDDDKGVTLESACSLNLKKSSDKMETNEKYSTGKKAVAFLVGQLIAKKGLEKGTKEVVFDRGGYKYQGRIEAIAEGARAGGLKF
ncbi:MAG: 50S ribosomal protein L18 [Patescibacteria group bacterium]|nr:50S ribosomal protein L18 [Patescibacteria group bacterium]MDD5164656.1 50S ribosomal protein L18 [Patescibacteria group bacterium]MDD5534818.1 50S ribosomal protein L18 [Patescibacteria group bacterium]